LKPNNKKIPILNIFKIGIFNFTIFAKNLKMYKLLAKLNKALLPSFTKQGLDPIKAKKWQKALIAYRYIITVKSLD
jgi:hypothetical protein